MSANGRKAGLILVLTLAVAARESAGRSVMEEFKIVPGKDSFQEAALDTPPTAGSTCTFRWTAVGATTEVWILTIDGNPETQEVECVASRAGGGQTYLLFKKVSMKVGEYALEQAEMYNNDGDALEENSVFEVSEATLKTKPDWKGSQVREVRALASMEG